MILRGFTCSRKDDNDGSSMWHIDYILGAFACPAFSRLKWISAAKSAKLLKSAIHKASFTFARDLRPKAPEQNSATVGGRPLA